MIRIKTAVKAVQAAIVGDKEKCDLAQPKEDIQKYCTKNFKGAPADIADCMVILSKKDPA